MNFPVVAVINLSKQIICAYESWLSWDWGLSELPKPKWAWELVCYWESLLQWAGQEEFASCLASFVLIIHSHHMFVQPRRSGHTLLFLSGIVHSSRIWCIPWEREIFKQRQTSDRNPYSQPTNILKISSYLLLSHREPILTSWQMKTKY